MKKNLRFTLLAAVVTSSLYLLISANRASQLPDKASLQGHTNNAQSTAAKIISSANRLEQNLRGTGWQQTHTDCSTHCTHHHKTTISAKQSTITLAARPFMEMRNQAKGSTFSYNHPQLPLRGTLLSSHEQEDGSWMLALQLKGFDQAVMSLSQTKRHGLRGSIENASGTVAYRIRSNHGCDQLFITPCDSSQLVCSIQSRDTGTSHHEPHTSGDALEETGHDNPTPSPAAAPRQVAAAASASFYQLQSRPGSPNTIYLDFDGETVANTHWNAVYNFGQPIVASPSSITLETNRRYCWHVVAQDYYPFNVNVTTDRSVYEATPDTHRMMLVFTDTYEWRGSNIAGTASLNSFGDPYKPVCWVFTQNNAYYIPRANTASHELGHTFGLSHDGDSVNGYHPGHNGDSTYASWRPIMGTGARDLVTFDHGGYSDANNSENDLSMINSYLGAIYDEQAGETQLPHSSDGTVSFDADILFAPNLLPETSDDYTFVTAGGTVELQVINYASTVDPEAISSSARRDNQGNLDLKLEILNKHGAIVAQDLGLGQTPGGEQIFGARIITTLPAGEYTARVTTTNAADPTYYSTYGQLGPYHITGSFSPSNSLHSPTSRVNVFTNSGDAISPEQIDLSLLNPPAGYNNTSTFSVSTINAPWLSVTPGSGTLSKNGNQLQLDFDSSQLEPGTYATTLTIVSPDTMNSIQIPVSLVIDSEFENNNKITIPNLGSASPYPSIITVPVINSSILETKVSLDRLSHNNTSDISVLLTSPAGKKIMLLDQNGIFGVSNYSMTFQAGATVPGSNPLLLESVYSPAGPDAGTGDLPAPAPNNPYTDQFDSLIGSSPTGQWKLYIYDHATGNNGDLDGWSIHFTFSGSDVLAMTAFSQVSPQNHQMSFTSQIGSSYVLESSDNLKTNSWQVELNITATSSETTVVCNADPADQQRFWRIRLLP